MFRRETQTWGSLDSARLTFSQKLALIDTPLQVTSYLLPGLRRLNAIRNRLAHSLRADVTPDDAKAFLDIELFRAMRTEKARRESRPLSSEPIDILDAFAQFAGIMFHAVASGTSEIWAEAIRRASEDDAAGRPTSREGD
jgi:hypothetical protein